MKYEEAQRIMHKEDTYVVMFEQRDGVFLRGCHFPDVGNGEPGLTREQAMLDADCFAVRAPNDIVNIYVARSDFRPIGGHVLRKHCAARGLLGPAIARLEFDEKDHFAPVAPPRAEADEAEVERVALLFRRIVRGDDVDPYVPPEEAEVRLARRHLAEVAKARAEGRAYGLNHSWSEIEADRDEWKRRAEAAWASATKRAAADGERIGDLVEAAAANVSGWADQKTSEGGPAPSGATTPADPSPRAEAPKSPGLTEAQPRASASPLAGTANASTAAPQREPDCGTSTADSCEARGRAAWEGWEPGDYTGMSNNWDHAGDEERRNWLAMLAEYSAPDVARIAEAERLLARAEARAKEAESLLADLRPLLGQRLTDIDRVHEDLARVTAERDEARCQYEAEHVRNVLLDGEIKAYHDRKDGHLTGPREPTFGPIGAVLEGETDTPRAPEGK